MSYSDDGDFVTDLAGKAIDRCDKCNQYHADEFVLDENDNVTTRRVEGCVAPNDEMKVLAPFDKTKLPRI